MKLQSQVIYCFLALLLFASLGNAQSRTRIVDENNPRYLRYNLSNAPIEITKREIGNLEFSKNGQIVGGSDWLGDLAFSIKNVSKKPIRAAEINLIIEKQGKMSNDYVLLLRFPEGLQEPSIEAGSLQTPEKLSPKVLEPGETVKLKVNHGQLLILNELKQLDVTDVDRVSVIIYEIRYLDGTGWFQGMETREYPTKRKKEIGVIYEVPVRLTHTGTS